MNIPEQATDAAMREFYGAAYEDTNTADIPMAINQMREAINAAAPLLIAAFLEEVAIDWARHQRANMGYGTVEQIGAWLRARANDVRNEA